MRNLQNGPLSSAIHHLRKASTCLGSGYPDLDDAYQHTHVAVVSLGDATRDPHNYGNLQHAHDLLCFHMSQPRSLQYAYYLWIAVSAALALLGAQQAAHQPQE